MTAFEEATVRAFLARTQLGDSSPEYAAALDDMERLRWRPVAAKTCSRCGRPGHNVTTCENLGGDR